MDIPPEPGGYGPGFPAQVTSSQCASTTETVRQTGAQYKTALGRGCPRQADQGYDDTGHQRRG